MTISEASAVNTLIDALYDERPRYPDPDIVEEAAVYLAERAYTALSAGWDGKRVRARPIE